MDTDQQQEAAGGRDDTDIKSTRNTAGTHRKTSIDLLKIIHAARQTYGLRTNDYGRYHAHAARRVATLHRSTKTLNKPSSKKNAASTGRSKKAGSSGVIGKAAYTSTTSQISADNVLKDERLLELLVWETERAWSEGMKQREEIASLERSGAPQALAPKRHRAVKRFQRAVEHATKLSSVAQTLYKRSDAPFAASAAFQIEIYRHYMLGTLGFVKATSPGASATQASSSPASALKSLGSAYVLLENYAEATAHSTEEAIAFELLDELEPLVRFCAYKAGTQSNGPPAEIARSSGAEAMSELEANDRYPDLLIKLAHEEKATRRNKNQASDTVKHLCWRDIDLHVRSVELAELLGRVGKAVSELGHRPASSARNKVISASAFDRSLATLIEAEDKARKLVDDNSVALSRAHSTRFEAAAKPLNLVYSYIVFRLLSVRLQRDEALLKATLVKLARREAKFNGDVTTFGPMSMRVKRKRVKLYPVLIKLLEGMIQSLERIRSLTVVEDDSAGLADETDALLAYTRARRCLYLGETYAMLDKYPEALTLIQRGNIYVRQSQTFMASVDGQSLEQLGNLGDLPSVKSAVVDLPVLQNLLERTEARASRDWYAYTLQPIKIDDSIVASDASLGIGVESMSLNKELTGRRSRKAAKIGPVFFDVAFSYIATVHTDEQAAQLPKESVVEQEQAAVAPAAQRSTDLEGAPASQSSAEAQPAGRGLWGFFGRRK